MSYITQKKTEISGLEALKENDRLREENASLSVMLEFCNNNLHDMTTLVREQEERLKRQRREIKILKDKLKKSC